MSSCIEFCGKPKKRNQKPEGEFRPLDTEIPTIHKDKQSRLRNEDALNRLKYVQVVIGEEKVSQPPRGIDINIDM